MSHTTTTLTAQLRKIIKEKQHLEARWRDINRRLKYIAASQVRYDDLDDWESSMRLVSGAADDLEQYLESIETEIEKVEWGIEELNVAPEGKVTSAFMHYMYRDMKLALKNLHVARESYDQVVKDIAALAQFGEEE
jgi:predicted nuclease with TOPRIM domain